MHCKSDVLDLANGIWNVSDSKRLEKLGHILWNILYETVSEEHSV